MVSTLQNLFEKRATAIAHEQGVVKRRSKITGSLLLLLLVIGFVSTPSASLNLLSQLAQD